MAEQTREEILHAKHIDMLEKQLAEAKLERERERELARREYQERLKEATQQFEDRRNELIAQNDAMLSTVGRLHNDNEAMKNHIGELEHHLQDMEASRDQAVADLRQEQEDHEAAIKGLEEKAKEQITKLEIEIDTLRQKTKKKI